MLAERLRVGRSGVAQWFDFDPAHSWYSTTDRNGRVVQVMVNGTEPIVPFKAINPQVASAQFIISLNKWITATSLLSLSTPCSLTTRKADFFRLPTDPPRQTTTPRIWFMAQNSVLTARITDILESGPISGGYNNATLQLCNCRELSAARFRGPTSARLLERVHLA